MSLNGLFAIRKPKGITSAAVLNLIQPLFRSSKHFQDHLVARDAPGHRSKRRKLAEKRVKMGHGGTLDPLASGVLVVGVGSGTKKLGELLGGWKEYEAACVFGIVTDMYDAEGKILRRTPTSHITKHAVEMQIESFRGEIQQRPPIFSALRIDGVRAYELARAGKEFPRELALRSVKVSDLEMIEWIDENSFPPPKEEASQDEQDLEKRVLGTASETQPEQNESIIETEIKEEDDGVGQEEEDNLKKPGPACRLRMTVSGGFYVRSLCYDLGLKMNSGAYMADLVRTKQGDFTFEEAVPWEDFTGGGPWEDKVVSILQNPPKHFKEPEGFRKSDEGIKSRLD